MQENIKRNFFWNTLGAVLYQMCTWLTTILVVRLAGFEVSGLLGTAMTVTNTFITLASYGMRTYQVSDADNRFSQRAYLDSRLITCGIAAFFCMLLSFAIPYSYLQRICIALYLLYRLSEPFSDVLHGMCQKDGKLYIAGKSYILRSFTTLIPFAVGLLFTKNLPITLGLMCAFTWGAILLYDSKAALPYFKGQTGDGAIELLWVCAPLALYSVLSTASASLPKLFLERELGTELMGIYNSVTAPVLLLQVGAAYLFTPLITLISSRVAQKDKKGFLSLILRVAILLALLLPVGLVGAAVVGEWGLKVFVSKDAVPYAYLLLPMVVAAVETAMVLFASMLLTILRVLKGLVIANCAGIAVSLVASVPLIRMFSMQGATYAAILALTVQLACLIAFGIYGAKKYFKA
ncbi:MAG: hypothetical protein RSF00_08800 [Oscillospiraceae bacterium]